MSKQNGSSLEVEVHTGVYDESRISRLSSIGDDFFKQGSPNSPPLPGTITIISLALQRARTKHPDWKGKTLDEISLLMGSEKGEVDTAILKESYHRFLEEVADLAALCLRVLEGDHLTIGDGCPTCEIQCTPARGPGCEKINRLLNEAP